jgi:hypothetical protein
MDTYICVCIYIIHIRADWQAKIQEKTITSSNKRLNLEDMFILFSLGRKAVQDTAGLNIGQDTVSAINLMEFNAGMGTCVWCIFGVCVYVCVCVCVCVCAACTARHDLMSAQDKHLVSNAKRQA